MATNDWGAAEAAELAMLSTAFARAPMPALILDEGGVVRWVNEQAAKLARRPSTELLGLRFGEALGCVRASEGCMDSVDCAGCPLGEVVSASFVSPDPTQMVELGPPFELAATPLSTRLAASSAQANIGGLRRSVLMITPLRPGEGGRASASSDLETLTNALAEALFTVRLPQRKIEFVNRAAEEMFGMSAKQMIGQPTSILYPSPELAKAFGTKLAAALIAGEAQLRTEHVFARGGERFWGAVSTTFLYEDGGEDPTRVISVLSDISERKRIEDELRASEARYRAIFTRAPVGIVLFELGDERCREVNERMLEISGYTREQTLAQQLFSSIHPEDMGLGVQALGSLREAERGTVELEARLLRPDGELTYVRMLLIALGSRGAGELGMAIVQDITERRHIEQQKAHIADSLRERQKLDSLGMLAGGIAHDINNILSSVSLNTELLRLRVPSGGREQRKLDGIADATSRAAELTRQLLAYAGKGRLIIDRINLSELVDSTDQLLRLSVAKDTELAFELEPFTVVEADATQLRQVLMNLVINASQALPGGRGQVRVRVRNAELRDPSAREVVPGRLLPAGPYIELEVQDEGHGIEPDKLKQIFDPFFTTKDKGHGLGLSAILGIANAHGGGVQVHSVPGQGTSFRVLLPLAGGSPTALRTTSSQRQEWQGAGRALLVEDEALLRLATREMLEYLGYEVDEACHGGEALERVEAAEDSYAFVLLDLTMPVMNGLETLQHLAELAPQVPVILVSGFSKHELSERYRDTGFAAFMHKPYGIEELVGVLRGLFEPEAPELAAPEPARSR